MALSANTPRAFEFNEDPLLDHVPAKGASVIWEGSAVGKSAGYGRALVAADVFLGFAIFKCDNSAGADGAKYVKVRRKGEVLLTVVGVTGVADIGSTVYASDDGTFTLTSTSNTAIGKVSRYVTGTKVMVRFEADNVRSI